MPPQFAPLPERPEIMPFPPPLAVSAHPSGFSRKILLAWNMKPKYQVSLTFWGLSTRCSGIVYICNTKLLEAKLNSKTTQEAQHFHDFTSDCLCQPAKSVPSYAKTKYHCFKGIAVVANLFSGNFDALCSFPAFAFALRVLPLLSSALSLLRSFASPIQQTSPFQQLQLAAIESGPQSKHLHEACSRPIPVRKDLRLHRPDVFSTGFNIASHCE